MVLSESVSSDSSTHSRFFLPDGCVSATRPVTRAASIETAIYGHIQALRALGKQRITSLDIAQALSLPLGRVNDAVKTMRDKGVYPIQ